MASDGVLLFGALGADADPAEDSKEYRRREAQRVTQQGPRHLGPQGLLYHKLVTTIVEPALGAGGVPVPGIFESLVAEPHGEATSFAGPRPTVSLRLKIGVNASVGRHIVQLCGAISPSQSAPTYVDTAVAVTPLLYLTRGPGYEIQNDLGLLWPQITELPHGYCLSSTATPNSPQSSLASGQLR